MLRPRRPPLPKAEEGGCLEYVVHKHKARAMHYDFRLEIGGAMPSWSIPKGPTLDPSVRRLAMPTGPHDLEYRKFEGVIGSGYGAGVVMVWDAGTYNPELEVAKGIREEVKKKGQAEQTAAEEMEKGNLKFRLYGRKLSGSFALVKTGMMGAKESWLLIKHKDGSCVQGYDANSYSSSAVSNLTMDEIFERGAKEKGPTLD